MSQSAVQNTYLEVFESITAHSSSVVNKLRREGVESFASLGFPTTDLERWRFTNVSPIAKKQFTCSKRVDIEASLLPSLKLQEIDGPQLVFVNGWFSEELSNTTGLPAGVEIENLEKVFDNKPESIKPHLGKLVGPDVSAFTALNTALIQDGAVIRIAENVVFETPMQLLFIASADDFQMSQPRILVIAGENSQIKIIENYASLTDTRYLTNTVTEISVANNAMVDHYKLIRESADAYHIGNMHIELGRSASFSSHSMTLGGAIVSNDVNANLSGPGGECTLNGLYLVDHQRLVDNHTTIRHASPHCTSHELYKGILADQARAVFNGKIMVALDAQKTDAKQTNKALLLSEDAQINTKPELEIFADDVKCTHGATVGQLDDEALFYLRSRGLSKEQSRNLLIHAFASDLLNRIRVEPIRMQLDSLLLQQFPGSSGGFLS
tara:strand:- start:2935 stop:4251 length:1317 start_codon:yes stop_codon:yes gene_type:complete